MLAVAGDPVAEARGEGESERDLLVSELWSGTEESPVLRALIEWPLKLVVPPEGEGAPRLHDLSSEAGEGVDLAKARRQERAELEALERLRDGSPAALELTNPIAEPMAIATIRMANRS